MTKSFGLGKGWHGDPIGHSNARRGIKTKKITVNLGLIKYEQSETS